MLVVKFCDKSKVHCFTADRVMLIFHKDFFFNGLNIILSLSKFSLIIWRIGLREFPSFKFTNSFEFFLIEIYRSHNNLWMKSLNLKIKKIVVKRIWSKNILIEGQCANQLTRKLSVIITFKWTPICASLLWWNLLNSVNSLIVPVKVEKFN